MPRPPRVHHHNSISIRSAVFAGLTVVTNTHRNHTTFVSRINAMLYRQCGLIMATIMVSPDHIDLYKLSLSLWDPGSYNRLTCHPWVGKLGPMIPHSKQHVDRFSRFCRDHGRDQQTDRQTYRQTDDATCVATTGHSHLTLRSLHQPPACVRDPASISTNDLFYPGFSSRPGMYLGPSVYLQIYGTECSLHRILSSQ